MSVTITSSKWTDEFNSVYNGGADTGTPNFMGCVGDLMWLETQFYVSWSANYTFTFSATNDTITITNFINWSTNGFQVGDVIEVVGSVSNDGTYNVTAINNNILTVAEDITIDETVTCVIYGTTPVTAFDYYYNMLGNNDGKNFVSLTDNPSIQRFTGKIADEGAAYMNPNQTSWAWWDWYAYSTDLKPQLTYLDTIDYKQYFKIVFPFFIKPFNDKSQLNLLTNAYNQNIGDNTILNIDNFIEPSYFFQQCLGYVQQIDAKFSITNTKADHTSGIVSYYGNTSWFDQFYPSGQNVGGNIITTTQYEFVSISYDTGDSMRSDAITNVTIELKNLYGTWTKNDKYVLHFCWLPIDAVKYQAYSDANQQNFRYSFLYDRAYSQPTASAVNGDMFGLDIQAITNLTSTSVGNILTINFDLDLGGLTERMLKEIPNYMIWVTPESELVTDLNGSFRSPILCDVNQAFINTDDSTLLQFYGLADNVVFYSQNENAKTDFLGLIGEYGFALSFFKVKENCLIKRINASIVVQSGSPYDPQTYEFPLEQWNNQTAEYWNGKLTDIEIYEFNGFNVPTSNPENTRYITRKEANDGGGYYAYGLGYGFQVGYQFWQNILDFPAQYMAYANNYYAFYTQGQIEFGNFLLGDYTTKVRFKLFFEILDNTTGITTEFVNYADMTFYDGLNNFSDYDGNNKTFDYAGNDLNGGVLFDTQTSIISFFESKLSLNPIGSGTPIIEMIIYYELGNKSYWDRILTTDTAPQDNSVWTVVPTIVSTTYQVTAASFVDFSSFETKPNNVRLYSKLYY